MLASRVMGLNLLPILKINRVAKIYKTPGCLKFKHVRSCSDFHSLYCMCSVENVSSHPWSWAGWREKTLCKIFVFTSAPAVKATQRGAWIFLCGSISVQALLVVLSISLSGHVGRRKKPQERANACPREGIKRYFKCPRDLPHFLLHRSCILCLLCNTVKRSTRKTVPRQQKTTTNSLFSFFQILKVF